jgi:hypothetical protein
LDITTQIGINVDDKNAHLLVTIDHKKPIDLIEFTLGLLAIGNQYSSFMGKEHSEALDEQYKLYIRKIEQGSIVAEIVHFVSPFLTGMDNINIFLDFINHMKEKLLPFFKPNGRNEDLTITELKDFHKTLRLVADNPDNHLKLAAAVYKDDKRELRQEFSFDGKQSSAAIRNIESQIQENEKKGQAYHQKVLMTFYQTNKNEAKAEKKLGERAIIESIWAKPLPVVFVSNLVGNKIKNQILSGINNPYKLGFIVDVNVETHKGNPACYRVIEFHQIVELD